MTVNAVDFSQIASLNLCDLRRVWAEHIGKPPRLRSPELLALMLAYRLQASVEGGIEVETRRSLRRSSAPKRSSALTPGTLLSREWKGIRQEVTVGPNGLLQWGGGEYRSLSQVARAITGVRWNGPRFFGLRDEP